MQGSRTGRRNKVFSVIPRIHSAQELSELLGVSSRTAYYWLDLARKNGINVPTFEKREYSFKSFKPQAIEYIKNTHPMPTARDLTEKYEISYQTARDWLCVAFGQPNSYQRRKQGIAKPKSRAAKNIVQNITLEDVQKTILWAFETAGKTSKTISDNNSLIAENKILKEKLVRVENDLTKCMSSQKKREENDRQLRLAIQNGEMNLNEYLVGGKK